MGSNPGFPKTFANLVSEAPFGHAVLDLRTNALTTAGVFNQEMRDSAWTPQAVNVPLAQEVS